MTNLKPLAKPLYSVTLDIVLSMLLLVLFLVAQWLGGVVLSAFFFTQYGTIVGFMAIFTLIVIVLAIWLAVRFRYDRFCEFMAMAHFHWKQLLGFAGALLLLNLVIQGVTVWLDRNPMQFMDELITTANPVWLLVVAIVVIVPIYEEMIFRGFMWSALVNSKMGVWGASIVSSILFAVVHAQYGWVEWVGIFALAMLFSYARYCSGSLWLPIVLHILNNGLAMAEYLWLN